MPVIRRAGSPRLRRLIRVNTAPRGPEKAIRIMDEDPEEEFVSKEVDPILDKISAHGMQSLTDRERAILEAARSKMGKR
jgi:hypothetical protein